MSEMADFESEFDFDIAQEVRDWLIENYPPQESLQPKLHLWAVALAAGELSCAAFFGAVEVAHHSGSPDIVLPILIGGVVGSGLSAIRFGSKALDRALKRQ